MIWLYLARVCYTLAFGTLVYAAFIFPFMHPEATNTQLFLVLWPFYVLGVSVGAFGFTCHNTYYKISWK